MPTPSPSPFLPAVVHDPDGGCAPGPHGTARVERALARLRTATRGGNPIEIEVAARTYGAALCRAGVVAAAHGVGAGVARTWRRLRPAGAPSTTWFRP